MEIYTLPYRLRSRDVNLFRRLRSSQLFELLQEAATDHSELLGAGIRDIRPKNLMWVLSRQSAEATIRALQLLNSVSEPKDVYVERDIPGLGANFLREAERQRAIRTYGLFLERYALTSAMTTLEENPELLKSGQPVAKLLFGKETLRDVCRLVKIPAQLVLIIRRYRQVEKDWRDSILDALREERELGSSVFDDWRETHPDELQGMGFVQDEVKESDRRVRILLGQLRAMKG